MLDFNDQLEGPTAASLAVIHHEAHELADILHSLGDQVEENAPLDTVDLLSKIVWSLQTLDRAASVLFALVSEDQAKQVAEYLRRQMLDLADYAEANSEEVSQALGVAPEAIVRAAESERSQLLGGGLVRDESELADIAPTEDVVSKAQGIFGSEV